VRTTSQTAEQERSLNDHSLQLLRDELATVKQSLCDCQHRENSVSSVHVFAHHTEQYSMKNLHHWSEFPVPISFLTMLVHNMLNECVTFNWGLWGGDYVSSPKLSQI
jgi:hypothetical protein